MLCEMCIFDYSSPQLLALPQAGGQEGGWQADGRAGGRLVAGWDGGGRVTGRSARRPSGPSPPFQQQQTDPLTYTFYIGLLESPDRAKL